MLNHMKEREGRVRGKGGRGKDAEGGEEGERIGVIKRDGWRKVWRERVGGREGEKGRD